MNKIKNSKKVEEVKTSPISLFPKSDLDNQEKLKIVKLASSAYSFWQGWTHQDLIEFSDYFRIFKFQKSTYLARRDQLVDYVGCVLLGRALIQIDNRVYATAQPGEVIGYMSALFLPKNKKHFFDIVGQTQGLILTINLNDLKLLGKHKPYLNIKLLRSLYFKMFSTVSYQYLNYQFRVQVRLQQCTLNQRKVNECFQKGQLHQFTKKQDKKDLKTFLSMLQYHQPQEGAIIFRKSAPQKYLIFVLQGQIYSSQQQTAYRQGRVYGCKNFLLDVCNQDQIQAKKNCLIAVFKDDKLQDTILSNVNIYLSLVKAITQLQCKKIKFLHSKLTGISTVPYFLDVELQAYNLDTQSDKISTYSYSSVNYDTPLYKLATYSTQKQIYQQEEKLMAFKNQEQKSEQLKQGKDKAKSKSIPKKDSKKQSKKEIKTISKFQQLKDNPKEVKEIKQGIQHLMRLKFPQPQLSSLQTFYLEKVQKNRIQKKSKQETIKTSTQLAKKLGYDFQQEMQQLQNQFNSLEKENKQLRRKLYELQTECKHYQTSITNLKNQSLHINAKVNMNLVFKQLQRRNQNSEGLFSSSNSKNKVKTISLGESLLQQLKFYSKYRSIVKFAYRWLFITRKRKKQRRNS